MYAAVALLLFQLTVTVGFPAAGRQVTVLGFAPKLANAGGAAVGLDEAGREGAVDGLGGAGGAGGELGAAEETGAGAEGTVVGGFGGALGLGAPEAGAEALGEPLPPITGEADGAPLALRTAMSTRRTRSTAPRTARATVWKRNHGPRSALFPGAEPGEGAAVMTDSNHRRCRAELWSMY